MTTILLPMKHFARIWALCALLSCIHDASSFVIPTTTTTTATTTATHRTTHPSTGALSVVADAQEEMRRHWHSPDNPEDSTTTNNNNNSDWTPTEGGFFPNYLTKTKSPSRMVEVKTLDDYKREVVTDQPEIVVVRFYAKWCGACKKIQAAYQRLPLQFPNVKFVQVPLTAKNAVLHQGLGVPSLPFAHIYHPDAGLVEELKIGRKRFPAFRDILQTYADGYCELDEDDEDYMRHEEDDQDDNDQGVRL